MNSLEMSVFFLILLFIACLNAPHDNIYDRKNPNQATIEGNCYEADGKYIDTVIISLYANDSLVDTDSSVNSYFEINDIIPGIYSLSMSTKYFSDVVLTAESLWADTYKIFDVYFGAWNFENDMVGTTDPYGFDVCTGTWKVIADNESPQMHSIPNVYMVSLKQMDTIALTMVNKDMDNFWSSVAFKVAPTIDSSWGISLVFRFINANNYCILKCSIDTLSIVVISNNLKVSERKTYHLLDYNSWHTLRLLCDSVFIYTYLDNSYILSGWDDRNMHGQLGLFVKHSFLSDEVQVTFDDFSLFPDSIYWQF